MTGSSGPSGSGLQFRRHRGRPGTLTQGGVVYTSLLFFMFISNKAPLHLFGKCELNSAGAPRPGGCTRGHEETR